MQMQRLLRFHRLLALRAEASLQEGGNIRGGKRGMRWVDQNRLGCFIANRWIFMLTFTRIRRRHESSNHDPTALLGRQCTDQRAD